MMMEKGLAFEFPTEVIAELDEIHGLATEVDVPVRQLRSPRQEVTSRTLFLVISPN